MLLKKKMFLLESILQLGNGNRCLEAFLIVKIIKIFNYGMLTLMGKNLFLILLHLEDGLNLKLNNMEREIFVEFMLILIGILELNILSTINKF